MNVKIDKEFKELVFPLTKEEYQGLEKSLLKEGCRDALVVWDGVLIDGHNRYELCRKHSIKFTTREHKFIDRDEAKKWILENQLIRRNLTPYQRAELALKLEPLIKEKAREKLKTHVDQGYLKSDKAVHTLPELAKKASVGHDTIYKVKLIDRRAEEKVKEKLRAGELTINKVFQDIRKEEKKRTVEASIQKAKKIEPEKVTMENMV